MCVWDSGHVVVFFRVLVMDWDFDLWNVVLKIKKYILENGTYS